jgi:hypothetical protein
MNLNQEDKNMKNIGFPIILVCVILGLIFFWNNINVGPTESPYGDSNRCPSGPFDNNNIVGYIDNVVCSPADCVLIRNGKKRAITPFQPLQTGDCIIVHKPGHWIQLRLNVDPNNTIRVTPNNSPYTVESTDDSPTSFFQKIEKLFSYFKRLYEDSWRNSNQVYTPSDCDSSTSSNGATTKKVGYKGLPLQKEEAQSIREAINNEPGLTSEAKNTLLAALLVMQQEGNWKQEASQLLNGIGTDYYPAVLVKKELNRR